MRTPPRWPVVLVVLVALAACKGEPFRPDAKIDAPLDAYEPPWWAPKSGEAANWDIQLTDDTNIDAERTMYDVDLWTVTPVRQITYSSGPPVDVPAGPRAGLIDQLHAKTPRPIVICYLRVATINLVTDPDRMKFPGFEANPPDNPTAPPATSVIGWSTGAPDERWLDIRPGSRERWAEILEKRLQLAKDIGCDGVDVANGVPFGDWGWGVPNVGHIRDFLRGIAGKLHDRTMSAGVRAAIGGLTDELDEDYDWTVLERCLENEDCEAGRPFTNLFKAVLAIDYLDFGTVAATCQAWSTAMVRDGIFKRDPPAGDFRMTCP